MTASSNKLFKGSVITILTLITILASVLVIKLLQTSKDVKKYKFDYYKVNRIKDGLLNGANWTDQVNKIISNKVDSFSLTEANKRVLQNQIGIIFDTLLTEVENVLHEKQYTGKDKIRFKVINTLVDIDKYRKEIPRFSAAVVNEIDKTTNREKFKELLKEKMDSLLVSKGSDKSEYQAEILKKYGASSIHDFNKAFEISLDKVEKKQKNTGYILISLLPALFLIWFICIKKKMMYKTVFIYSVIILTLTMIAGISLPMIDIDARIAELKLDVLSSQIVFYDQVIFFQTKSILDVIYILITKGKIDSVLVGIMILAFSVLFPITKMISSIIYLYNKENHGTLLKILTFRSAKWSMADVMVIAIFMAYIGFQGILNSELGKINMVHEHVNLVTTNKSNLQIGFLIFVCFSLSGLILSEILKYITKDEKLQENKAI